LKKLFLFLLLIGFYISSFGQKNELSTLDELISAIENISNADTLKHSYNNFISSRKGEFLPNGKIIYNVFLAKLIANQHENVNVKSTSLFNEALLASENSSNQSLLVWVQTQVGYYYYTFNKYHDAFPHFIKVSRVLDQQPSIKYLRLNEVLKKNAYFFITTLDYERTINYLSWALKITNIESEEYPSFLNTIAMAHFNLNDFNQAEIILNDAKLYALKYNHKLRYAKILGDLARVFIKQNKWIEAEKLLLEDIKISKELKEYRNTMFAQLQLGKMYVKYNNIYKAKELVTEAQQYAYTKSYLKGYELELSKLLLSIAIAQNDDNSELFFRRKIDSLSLFVSVDESNDIINQIWLKNQKEKVQWQFEAEKVRSEKQSLLKWMLAGITLLLITICMLIKLLYDRKLFYQKSDYESRLLAFRLEKLDSEKKLFQANNSLKSFKTFLKEKNKQIDELQSEIDVLSTSPHENNTEEKINLQQILNSHLMTASNWETFKVAFKNERREFYNEIIENFPGMSEANLRIILLQNIGLNNSEIAKIIGITVEGVKKAKQRLRKKYENTIHNYI
jgi:hypothetical protein